MNYPRIYIGPMSKNVVDSVIDVANETNEKFGLIPSRRQIDLNGGYSNNWTTKSFETYVKNRTSLITLERDHGGPNQGINNDFGYDSFCEDCSYLDIIHIDPWKTASNLNDGIDKTINYLEFCFNINNSIKYEIGTEETIFRYEADELEHILSSIKAKAPNIFDKITYAVVQSGTAILGTENVGIYSKSRLSDMVSVCNKFDIKSKEHNGDYLMPDQIKDRFDTGLDAINIAPEFGIAETDVILKFINQCGDKEKREKLEIFYELCFNTYQWKKWLPPDANYRMPYCGKFAEDKLLEQLIRVSGHYVISSNKYRSLLFNPLRRQYPGIQEDIKASLKSKLMTILGAL